MAFSLKVVFLMSMLLLAHRDRPSWFVLPEENEASMVDLENKVHRNLSSIERQARVIAFYLIRFGMAHNPYKPTWNGTGFVRSTMNRMHWNPGGTMEGHFRGKNCRSVGPPWRPECTKPNIWLLQNKQRLLHWPLSWQPIV